MERQQLTALAILVVVLMVGYGATRTAKESPFEAEENVTGPIDVVTLTGRVVEVNGNTIQVQSDDHVHNPPMYSITTETGTIVNILAPEEKSGTLADITVGDDVIVTPTENADNFTAVARYIDLFDADAE